MKFFKNNLVAVLLVVVLAIVMTGTVCAEHSYKVGETFSDPESYTGTVTASLLDKALNKTLFTAVGFCGVKKLMTIAAGQYGLYPYAQNRANAQFVCVNSAGVIIETSSTYYEAMGVDTTEPAGSFGFDPYQDGTVYIISDQPFSAKFYFQK